MMGGERTPTNRNRQPPLQRRLGQKSSKAEVSMSRLCWGMAILDLQHHQRRKGERGEEGQCTGWVGRKEEGREGTRDGARLADRACAVRRPAQPVGEGRESRRAGAEDTRRQCNASFIVVMFCFAGEIQPEKWFKNGRGRVEDRGE
jgi:hypothetical protein